MARKISESEKERLTDANIEQVIAMLNPTGEGEKPCTKKAACAFLGISYNTSRLDNLIEKYVERKQYEAERRAANKGKPATQQEIVLAIQSYIEGDAIEEIARVLFRSSTFVKNILVNHGVPIRPVSHDYYIPELIPEEAAKEKFDIGEVVYSAKYNVNAEVRGETKNPDGTLVYKIWLLGDCCRFAFTPVYELASLSHLRELGVKV